MGGQEDKRERHAEHRWLQIAECCHHPYIPAPVEWPHLLPSSLRPRAATGINALAARQWHHSMPFRSRRPFGPYSLSPASEGHALAALALIPADRQSQCPFGARATKPNAPMRRIAAEGSGLAKLNGPHVRFSPSLAPSATHTFAVFGARAPRARRRGK